MTQTTNIDSQLLSLEIQEALRDTAKWFESHYDIVSHHAFMPGSERIYLGQKNNRVCRYCGLTEPSVKFRKEAHAIPDQIGNDWLFDNEECDACNEHFAKWVEDDFAKWTLPWRSLGRISGKKGVPSHKSSDKQFRVDPAAKDDSEGAAMSKGIAYDLKIQMGVNDARHELDEATKSVKLTLDRQPYVPMGVFKCLVKMAIAVMPVEEAQRCAHLKDWILLPYHTIESYPYKPFTVLYQFFPGPLPNNHVDYWLLRRKQNQTSDCPYMQFALQLGNHVFQIMLPMHVEDRSILEAGNFKNYYWMHTWANAQYQIQYGRPARKLWDMSGTEQVRGETASMIFSYNRLIR